MNKLISIWNKMDSWTRMAHIIVGLIFLIVTILFPFIWIAIGVVGLAAGLITCGARICMYWSGDLDD